MNTIKSLNLVLDHTAFVAIDLQKGILGSGQLFPNDAATVLANNVELAQHLKNTDALNVLVNVDITEFRYLSTKNELAKQAAVPVIPKEFTDLLLSPYLEDTTNTLTVTKYNPSVFFGTSLDLQLRRRQIDTIILSGVATSNGVYATALDAFQHGYHVIVVEDACADRDLELHHVFFEKIFPKTARIRSTKEVISAIEKAKE
ncbi:isochorismatase family protein [Enterococcus durans]|uniref:Isochorismatase family protein n=1 Tax=Enterococcus durans TaxID=53345 RepID=A0A377KI75_9ENTE|nr:isochorismatase family protein [Enterococcus durans]STP28522.1 isochorismatase family protein [Enterococcus durans]